VLFSQIVAVNIIAFMRIFSARASLTMCHALTRLKKTVLPNASIVTFSKQG
jgi:hypothetical protein